MSKCLGVIIVYKHTDGPKKDKSFMKRFEDPEDFTKWCVCDKGKEIEIISSKMVPLDDLYKIQRLDQC